MPSLFEPLILGAVEARNRILMAPLTRARATRDHVPTPIMASYYAQRAGAGLIISEATAISRQGMGWPYAPGLAHPQIDVSCPAIAFDCRESLDTGPSGGGWSGKVKSSGRRSADRAIRSALRRPILPQVAALARDLVSAFEGPDCASAPAGVTDQTFAG